MLEKIGRACLAENQNAPAAMHLVTARPNII
jgi:hypothetical protein